jgi:protein-export membrane protein SecD
MLKDLRVRIGLIAALVLLSAWFLYDRGITLGLDLRGGTHLAMEVEDPDNALSQEQREDAIDRALRVIRTRVDELGVAEPVTQKEGCCRIVVELPGATREEQQRAKDVIQRSAFLQFQIVKPAADLTPSLARMDRAAAASGLTADTTGATPAETPGTPGLGGLFQSDTTGADTTGAAPDSVVAATADTTRSDTLGLGAANQQPLSTRLTPGSTGGEGVYFVTTEDAPLVERLLELPEVKAAMPRSVVLKWGQEPPTETGVRTLYLLDERPLITGEYLEDAQAQRDPQLGQPIVIFQFNRQGGRIFERGTGQNVGNLMAIVLDERVVSAPVIRSQIGARGQIEMGGGDIAEASDLALVLRAGALPAPIGIVEEQSIGPSLGQDSIDSSIIAGIIGSLLVILVMIGYYHFAGLLAICALTLYVLFVLAAMAGIDATLTLPGIAGFILSIGMAVDANVLIFERMREELAAGRVPRLAVSEGFHHALSAIVDGHITTLLTAFILFQFGTGPVKGFAITLAIGIIASLLTAIFVTRTFFMIYLARRPMAETISI